MNKNIHGIIIVMLGMCLLVSSATLYLLNTRLVDHKPEARMAPQAKIAVEKYCDSDAGGTGLCFDHAKSWSVSHYNDDFTSGQKNLEIGANAAGGRVTIERLNSGQKGMKGPRVAGYAGLYELGEMCSADDEFTCPQDQYYLSLDGDQTAYAVRAYYRWEDRAEIKPLVDTILYSVEIGP